jgi:ABC-type transport system involved in multi-copper enzyme maturation permease subunit
MTGALRSEIIKLRTTRTTLGTIAAMVGVVVLAIALHAFGLPAKNIAQRNDQLGVFIDVGENVGALFAALVGAIAITGEIRHGTIRPTFLTTPQRERVLAAKTIVVAVSGLAIGTLATGLAAGTGTLFMHFRDITINVHANDYATLILGGATAAALWAVIGLGVGAVTRNQVPAIVGMFVWVLFVENLLDGGFPKVGKFAPAALGRAIAGAINDGTVHTPVIAFALLAIYALIAIAVGWYATTRRDVT